MPAAFSRSRGAQIGVIGVPSLAGNLDHGPH